MKKLSLINFLIIMVVLSLPTVAQEVDRSQWITTVDSSAFDGISRICGVFGKSNDATYTSPLFALSKRGNDEIVAYLTHWPYGGCEGNKLYVKFDKEQNIYEPRLYYSSNTDQYYVKFFTSKMVAKRPNIWITQEQFIQKLKTCETLYMRLVSTCVSIDVEFTLNNADEVIKLFD